MTTPAAAPACPPDGEGIPAGSSGAWSAVPPGSGTADETGMRTSHAATALAAFTAGLTAAAALRRLAGHRANAATPATSPATTALPSERREQDHGAVVLAFPRPAVAGPVPEQPATQQPESPARCGDSGGRTKAGAPCGARTATGGRCHHHPVAA